MMKKLSLYVFLLLMFCNVGFADVTEVYCLIRKADLFRAKISPEDHSRFAGKEIVFAISFEEKLIADVSEDGEVSVITGMYGPKDTQEFEKIDNGIRYQHEIKLQGEKENEFVKYNYVNIVKIINNKPTEFLAKVDQSGFSFNSWNFQIECRDNKFSKKEKLNAKKWSGADSDSSMDKLKKYLEESQKKLLEEGQN